MKTLTTIILASVLLLGCGVEEVPAVQPTADADAERIADAADGEAPDASPDAVEDAEDAVDAAPVEFIAEAEDFTCLTEWTKVRRFYVQNTLGHLDEALAVANAQDGRRYPVGTIIQLIPDEAMVKRGAGYSAATNDWEFFALNTQSGETVIDARGTTDVVNFLGGNCLSCHVKAEPKWDFICEDGHGCDPLGIDAATIELVQDADPRCP